MKGSRVDSNVVMEAMLKAASSALMKKWPQARDYAGHEFQKFLLQIRHIENLKEQGKITEEEARFLAGLQQNAMKSVLLTIEGLGMLAVESAVNAAVGAVRDLLNASIGWKVL